MESISLQFLVLAVFFSLVCPLVDFMFHRGKRFDRDVSFRTNVPSVYQCAEFCMNLKTCTSLSFDKQNKVCHISPKSWDISQLDNDSRYIYATKNDIPKEIIDMCRDDPCKDNEICVQRNQSMFDCLPLYQCLDGSLNNDCRYSANHGGCDSNNVGRNLSNGEYWTIEYWGFLIGNCKRSCKICLEEF